MRALVKAELEAEAETEAAAEAAAEAETEAEAAAEAEVRAEADLRILRQPVAPLRLQRLLVSSAPRLRQLVGVGAVLRAHGHRASDAAEPPRRERRRWTGVQAGGAPQAEQEAGGGQMHPHRSAARRANTARLAVIISHIGAAAYVTRNSWWTDRELAILTHRLQRTRKPD